MHRLRLWTVFFTTTYEHNSDYEDRGGMYARNSDRGGMFTMEHRANSMSASTSTSALNQEDVWFVDSSALNHMTSHKEWFLKLREPKRPGYVETGDDTTHCWLVKGLRTSGEGESDMYI